MKKRYLAAFCLLLLALSVHAQPSRWEFRFAPRIWGVTVGGRYMLEPPSIDGVETSITGLVSAAYQSVGYFRAPDGSLYTVTTDETDPLLTSYDRMDLIWEAGVQQGILPRTDVTADRAVAFILYRGQYSLPFEGERQLFFQSGLPEADDSLRGSLVGGTAYQEVRTSQITRMKRGAAAELALEWGPAFLHNQILSAADYSRTTISARGFLPLYEIEPSSGSNIFSSYLAAFGIVDWATGPQIPLSVRSTTGGRSVRSGPGGSVRGYASGRFDSTFKAIGNLELRTNLPAIAVPGIVPGIVLYTDGGFYLDADSVSPSEAEASGVLLSSGAGLSLDLFDAAQLVFYTNYLWTETSVNGERWVPFSLGFGFHY